ncbi:hypothetical protein HO133_000169 [Letharia lupina]|uniref:Amidase domain-containing protein n=1 Tax=Letharia lupina TaxID=560253 RepID=A0A8H6FCG0_9LECA|nr:uncharacterized protein HO133_000169 [Letharia lupina]KAF6223327.1 hypothetical protein HO133_000169 [Letharia lupina]
MSWQSNAQGKRASLIELIPLKWRIPTSDIPSVTRLRDFGEYICRFLDRRELEITNAPSSRILANIRSGEWTSVDVTRAFCHRASVAHQLTNCLSEICFVAAEQRAKALDESFLRTGQTVGPLHGLPVSLKDRFNIDGLESACGYVSWLGKEKSENDEGILVKRLRRMGAVFFVKTNVPMSMLLPGLPVNGSVVGPMAGDLPTIEMAMKVVLDTFPWQDDCDVLEMPWREEKLQNIRSRTARHRERDGKLVFAVMSCDGNVQVHPPVQRAMALVTKALLQRGYEVIEWQPPPHHDAVQTLVRQHTADSTQGWFQILGSTAGKEVRNAIDASGEPPVHQLQTWYDNDNVEPSSSAEFWDLCNQRDQYRSEYNQYWTSTREKNVAKRQVDGVIMPVAPTAAVEEGCFDYYAYSGIVNLLDYTSGSFPVTFADRSIDVETPDHVPLNPTDRAVWRTYQKDLFDGAPVGLQVMGKRFEEEKVLGLMEALTAALQDFSVGQIGEPSSPF